MYKELLQNKTLHVESETRTYSKKYEDGSYDETTVEKVEGGYIKTVCKNWKDEKGDWQYDTQKSVSIQDPIENKSLIDKLSEVIKGIE